MALVSGLSITEAAATGVAAFATRDIFAALRAESSVMPTLALLQLALAGLFATASRLGHRTAAEWLGQSFATSTRRVLFRHLLQMEQRTIAQRRAGAWGLRFVGDLSALRAWVGRGVTDIIAAAIVLPGAALVLWLLNPTLAWHAVIPISGSLLLMLILLALFEPLQRSVRSGRASIAIDMMERVTMAPQLALAGRSKRELTRLNRAGEALRDDATRRAALRAALRSIPDAGAVLGGVAVLWAAGQHAIPAAEAAAALAVLGIIAVPLRGLAFVWDRRVAWIIAREKLQRILDQPTLKRGKASTSAALKPTQAAGNKAGNNDPKSIKPAVGFHADALVSYGLPLTLRMMPGEKQVLSAAPGAGASAALRLLAGLDQPDAGTLVFDTDNGGYPETLLVSADAPILYGSLRRNLTLGLRGKRPTDESLLKAVQTAGLDGLVRRIGLSGKVNESGVNLSRRERLAILLVRALLANPQLLLIDLPEIAGDSALTRTLQQIVQTTPATLLLVWPAGHKAFAAVPEHILR